VIHWLRRLRLTLRMRLEVRWFDWGERRRRGRIERFRDWRGPVRRLRVQARRMKRSPGGRDQFALGLRLGYWPCLRAPYVQLVLLCWRFDLWFGLPTYNLGA
jgi:hypothetical protein